MKHTILTITASAALAFGSITATRGQEAIQQTTTSTTTAGTISEFSPQTIVVKTENAPEPIRYTYSKSTIYVDEDGNPVSMETVKSGLPVTVYYQKTDDGLVASKVIVRKTVVHTVPAPVNVEKSTTTTTTTTTDK